jgi:hypothetical protein
VYGKFDALPVETVIEQRQGDSDWSRARRMWRISCASSRRSDIALSICFTQFRINHGVQQSLGVASLPL